MELFLKIILVIVFFTIFYQDNKDRLVSAYLYFLVAFLGTILHPFYSPNYFVLFFEVLINLLVIFIVLLVAYLTSRLIFKNKFLNHSFGIGDTFMFLSLSFLFPSSTFIVFFVFSLFFSLFIHILFNTKNKTIPLAGFMSLFYGLIYIFTILFKFNPYTTF